MLTMRSSSRVRTSATLLPLCAALVLASLPGCPPPCREGKVPSAPSVGVQDAHGNAVPITAAWVMREREVRRACTASYRPTGGGHHAIVLRAGSQQRTLEVDVQDDGCNAFRPQVPDVVF